MFKTLFAKLAGKFIAKKLDLKEGNVDTKKWWQSKTIWSGVVTVLLAGYAAASAQFKLPPVPDWIFAILGAIGIYSRATANTKIG